MTQYPDYFLYYFLIRAVSTLSLSRTLSLGYFDGLFIIECTPVPGMGAGETASLVSLNTVQAGTQQPQNLINKQLV